MNLIPELTTETNIDINVYHKAKKKILRFFRENKVSIAQARVLFEDILQDMERTPLR